MGWREWEGEWEWRREGGEGRKRGQLRSASRPGGQRHCTSGPWLRLLLLFSGVVGGWLDIVRIDGAGVRCDGLN